MPTCERCGAVFPKYPTIDGIRMDLRGRKRCLDCLPRRRLARPRKSVVRPVAVRTCAACGAEFPAKMLVDGRIRSLYRRRFCLTCSPFGIHNTSLMPPGPLEPIELARERRRRRNANTYRYQKRRRRELKAELVAERGGRCESCGYEGATATLEFHHRDASTKEFQISRYSGVSIDRLLAEAAKCDLLCANCHRMRHAALDLGRGSDPTVAERRRRKTRAVRFMGGVCEGCAERGPDAIFEFHHRNAAEKDFGLSESGIPRRWGEGRRRTREVRDALRELPP